MSEERICPPHAEPPKKSHLGLAVASLGVGAFLLFFPKYVPFGDIAGGFSYFVGAIFFVIGIIGTCLELFPEERNE